MNVANDRHTRFRQRQRAKGYRQVAVWVPERDTERLKRYAEELSRDFEKEQRTAMSGSKEAE